MSSFNRIVRGIRAAHRHLSFSDALKVAQMIQRATNEKTTAQDSAEMDRILSSCEATRCRAWKAAMAESP